MMGRILLVLLATPFVELLLLREAGARMGWLAVWGVILMTGMFGVWLVRIRGLRVLRRVVEALHAGRLPRDEVLDDLLALGAGFALLTPGFLGDVVGVLLLVPFCRSRAERWLARSLEERWARSAGPGEPGRGRRGPGSEVVIDAEVIRPGRSKPLKP